MAFCSKCGDKLSDDAVFCPNCGNKISSATNNNSQQPGGQQNNNNQQYGNQNGTGNQYNTGNANNAGNNFSDTVNNAFNKFNNTGDSTREYDPKDIADNKIIALISYFWILFFIPLVASPNSKFGRFHANQALVLFIAEIVLGIGVGIFNVILLVIGLGLLGVLLSACLGLLTLGAMILGIYNAATGKAKELPLIGKIKLIK